MSVEVKMPRMGQSMEEGTLLNWLIQPGASVKAGEPIAEIETDKAVIELEAVATGKMSHILVKNGETVSVGTILGYIDDGAPDGAPDEISNDKADSVKETISAIARDEITLPEPTSPSAKPARTRFNASPLVKRLAQEYKIDITHIQGSGPEGRIIKRDIESYLRTPTEALERSKRREISPVAKRIANEQNIDITGIRGTGPAGRIIKRDIEEVLAKPIPPTMDFHPVYPSSGETTQNQPLSKIKQATARLMVESKTTIPHFYVSMDVNMGQCLALRQSFKQRGHRVSVNQIILKAVALTLANYPNLNAEWRGDSIVFHPEINIAFAVALMDDNRPTGLITPVIHNCESMSLLQIASESNTIVERSNAGRLRANDMTGGTFTVSNLGMFGVKHFEAIVNPPQVAILAVGGIRKTPHFDEHERVIPIHEMTVTLSADHRVTDGAEVALFVRDLKAILEDGFALLID